MIAPCDPVVLISRCLLGDACRWHGRAVQASKTALRWILEHPEYHVIPICPEELGGLPTPRPPVKRVRGRVYETCAEKAMRPDVTGKDVTVAFQKGADISLSIAKRQLASVAILCKWSPSCDIGGWTGRVLKKAGLEIINTF